MSGRYKKYDNYQIFEKNNNLIPTHWKPCRLRFIAKIRNGQDYKRVEAESGYPVYGSGGQFTYSSTFLYNYESVLLGRKGTINKPLYIKNPFWTVDTMYYTEIYSKYSAKFFYYLCLTIPFDMYSTNTALPSMTQENLNDNYFSIPNDKTEQTQIANFLDYETVKIDTLIEKQKKLIELLKEKRQAVISHAVTRGLNPDAPMKDSGVEWLGEVPEHWNVKKLKFLVLDNHGIQMGPFGGMLKKLEYHETGFKLYGQENTISNNFEIGSRWLTRKRYFELINYSLNSGDLVLTRKGSLGNARLIQKLSHLGIIDSDTIRIRVNDQKISSLFLSILLHETNYISEQLLKNKRGSVLPGLNTSTISELILVLPASVDLQNKIFEKVLEIKNEYHKLISKANKAISLLQERRTALISAAVTGKIDVRDWVAPDRDRTCVVEELLL
ncbi:MAG: hypothetical protein B6241_15230 [Spirochaetaceae bacterium 4572_59]|nr:MAG: hypothetical protein B6241_15230 [Spirochaetaceae bacterium 4572_59]